MAEWSNNLEGEHQYEIWESVTLTCERFSWYGQAVPAGTSFRPANPSHAPRSHGKAAFQTSSYCSLLGSRGLPKGWDSVRASTLAPRSRTKPTVARMNTCRLPPGGTPHEQTTVRSYSHGMVSAALTAAVVCEGWDAATKHLLNNIGCIAAEAELEAAAADLLQWGIVMSYGAVPSAPVVQQQGDQSEKGWGYGDSKHESWPGKLFLWP
ncbi:hypothetical protein BJV78DRAFT_1159411 [Lactifluus subvellereus]|nr:hypothetical protein BJV78DRAFT_1159411 [Lactifluus subvellereus]